MTWIAGKEECTNGFYQHHVWWSKGNREGGDIKHFKRQDKNLKIKPIERSEFRP